KEPFRSNSKSNIELIYSEDFNASSLSRFVNLFIKTKNNLKTVPQENSREFNFTLGKIFNNTGVGVTLADYQGKIIKCNEAFCKMLNFTKEELYKMKFSDFTFHADRPKVIKLFNELLKGKIDYYSIEKRYVRKDGNIVWGDLTVAMIKSEDNKHQFSLGLVIDITSQKEANEKLKKAQDLSYTLLNNIPDSIYFKDLESRFIKVNNSAVKKLGFNSEEEVIGKTDFDIFKKVHAYKAYEDEQRIIKTGEPLVGVEEIEVWQDGKITHASTTKLPLKDDNGNIIGTFGITRDITERKEFEEIQKAQYKISEAVHSTPNIMTLYKKIHDVVRELMHAENFYIALYDEKTELISFPYFVDEYDAPPATRKLKKGLTEYVLKTGVDVLVDREKDEELKRKGEVELIGELQSIWLGIPLKIGDKVIGVMAVQDYKNDKVYGEKERQILLFVSEQIAIAIDKKRNAEALEKYSEELNQLNITKDKFFSIIAHDLKNPFITLLGFSDMLIHEYDELTEEEKLQYITEIRNSAKSSHELLENLLEWSRSQTGGLKYEPHQFDIYELVRRNFLLLNPMAKSKGIKLICEVNENTEVFADFDMINTVIRNLISNAVKFTNKDGEIKISAVSADGFLKLCVCDNGVGMDKKTLDKLFKLGEQHTSRGTSKETGTGLGLILCKEFIEKNYGKIWAESEIGKGTTFCFTIPINKNRI
ncbi:MAG: PAS domain S-box protein, partial [Melioribacteraceae bacterium]